MRQLAAGKTFADHAAILIAPGLRSADTEEQAEAWNLYRRTLLVLIREALTVGFSWSQILQRLHTTFSDPDQGYPRLVNHLDAALEETVLMKYPLLHADVLFYKLDHSYATGSTKYRANSSSVEWDSAVSRLPGEDPVSLAMRVTNAFIIMHDNPTITNVSVWSKPAFVEEINVRYRDCLENDLGNPERGQGSADHFVIAWQRAQVKYEYESGDALELSCERLARGCVIPYEIAYVERRYTGNAADNAALDAAPGSAPRLTLRTHTGGHGARARRDARRADLHSEEPPPSAYLNDTLP